MNETHAPSSSFTMEPFTENCRLLCHRGDHVVLGVSPGNSYFAVPLLTSLLGWLRERFARIDVVIPDSAVVHTYRALGYSPERAVKKARAETGVLRNRVCRAWEACGGRADGHGVHMMSSLIDNQTYIALHNEAKQVIRHDAALREACEHMSRTVLLTRNGGQEPTAAQIDEGIHYLLAELPFFLGSADIFGVPSSLCFYHQPVPLADSIFSGRSALRPSPRQAYAIIRPIDLPVNRPRGGGW